MVEGIILQLRLIKKKIHYLYGLRNNSFGIALRSLQMFRELHRCVPSGRGYWWSLLTLMSPVCIAWHDFCEGHTKGSSFLHS